jgi:hypothetical protein
MIVIYHRYTPLPNVRKGLDDYNLHAYGGTSWRYSDHSPRLLSLRCAVLVLPYRQPDGALVVNVRSAAAWRRFGTKSWGLNAADRRLFIRRGFGRFLWKFRASVFWFWVRATWPLEIVEYVQRCRLNSLGLDHGGSIRNLSAISRTRVRTYTGARDRWVWPAVVYLVTCTCTGSCNLY